MVRPTGDFTAGGYLVDANGMQGCTVRRVDGEVSIDLEEPSGRTDFEAVFVRDAVNGHTHCGDYGLKVPAGLSLEELVAPPDGLKHRYLSNASEKEIRSNMSSFSKDSASFGASAFIDFREGGLKGCMMLRESSSEAVILGRPVSEQYDPDEVSAILDVADGIGLPSISDMDASYMESVADDVRSRGKILSIHVSERVREDIDLVLSLDPTFIIHMCEASDSDMSKCAEAEVPVVVCPTSNMYFGKKPPVRRMVDAGIDICVGTDNGMLCKPDLGREAMLLSDLLARQGGDPLDAWGSLSRLSKLINDRNQSPLGVDGGRLMAVPYEGTGDNIPCRASGQSFDIVLRSRS